MPKKLTDREMNAHKRRMAREFREKNPDSVFEWRGDVLYSMRQACFECPEKDTCLNLLRNWEKVASVESLRKKTGKK